MQHSLTSCHHGDPKGLHGACIIVQRVFVVFFVLALRLLVRVDVCVRLFPCPRDVRNMTVRLSIKQNLRNKKDLGRQKRTHSQAMETKSKRETRVAQGFLLASVEMQE